MCVIKYFMYLSMNYHIINPPVSDLFYSQQENVCMCWYEFRAINTFFACYQEQLISRHFAWYALYLDTLFCIMEFCVICENSSNDESV